MIRQLQRFAGVGVVITLAHVLVALLMQSVFDLTPQIANFTGFCFASFLSYLGHSFVTFGATKNHGMQVPRFVLVALVGLVTSSAMTFLVVTHLHGSFVQAMAVVAVVVPPITFLVSKFWVFHEQ